LPDHGFQPIEILRAQNLKGQQGFRGQQVDIRDILGRFEGADILQPYVFL
jgi:hypothetical protein